MHYSFQWRLLLFWSVLFSGVCYGHRLSRVRTSGFGFVFAQETISDRFHFGEAHALVAVEITARIATNSEPFYQDRKMEEVDREVASLFRRDANAVIVMRDCSVFKCVHLPVFDQDVIKSQLRRFDDCPVVMPLLTPSCCRISTEGANVHNLKLDVRPASCFSKRDCDVFLLFAFAGDTFGTPMVRPFRVFDAPACFECGGIGGFVVWKVGGNTLLYGNTGKYCDVHQSVYMERNTRLTIFVHHPLTTATHHTVSHARHYSPARARKQPPPVPVLLSSAKTKNIAIFNSDRYTLLREVEELNHRSFESRSSGDSDSSLARLSRCREAASRRAHNPQIAGASPATATNILDGWGRDLLGMYHDTVRALRQIASLNFQDAA